MRAFRIVLIAALGVATPALCAAALIDDVRTDYAAISPNGDGVQEAMAITIAVSDTVTSLHVIIRGGDAVTPVDTLAADIPVTPVTPYVVTWDGTDFMGLPVPDGRFFVFVRAQDALESDSLSLEVMVDVSDPLALITNVIPSIFAPSTTQPQPSQQITLTLSDAPPSDVVRATFEIFDPDSMKVATLLTDSIVPANGTMDVSWRGTSATKDGIYRARITATDRAGNDDIGQRDLNIDRNAPTVEISGLEPGKSLMTIPDSLRGWAWDRNRIATLDVNYGQNRPFEPVQATTVRDDTVFFVVTLADTVVEQRTYTLRFRAKDMADRETIELFSVTFDTVPPTPPLLVQPPPQTRSPQLLLDGTVDDDLGLLLRIFRNGVLADTTVLNLSTSQWPYPLSLAPGENAIHTRAVDVAGNVSDPSNTINVFYDASGALAMPVPFVPGAVFQVNVDRPAQNITIRVYDLGGNLVVKLRSVGTGTSTAIPWDGLNGSGETARRGPLVAVAEIKFADGGKTIFRETFLFRP